MELNFSPELPSFELEEIEAIVAAGLFGAFQGGLFIMLGGPVLQFWRTDAIRRIGASVGVTSLNGAWLVLLLYGVLLTVPFVAFTAGSVNTYSNSIIMLSSRSKILQKILVPALKFSALGITLYGLGQVYGLIVGVLLWGIALPLWLNFVVHYPAPLPMWNGWTLFAWAVFGGNTGLVYGLIIEH